MSRLAFAVAVAALALSSSSARADDVGPAPPTDCTGDQTECTFADGLTQKCGTCQCQVLACEGGTICGALTPEACRNNASCTPDVDETSCSCTQDVEDCGGCGCRANQANGMFGVAGVAVAVAAGIAIGRRRRGSRVVPS